jgi:aminopeptidase 2
MSLAGIIHTWWEDDKVTQLLKAFRGVRCLFISFALFFCDSSCIDIPLSQALCSPLVEKLGLEYSKADSADITQLRTLAVEGAATVGDAA